MKTKYKIFFVIPYLIAYFLLFISAHNLSVQQSKIQLPAAKKSDTSNEIYTKATAEIINKANYIETHNIKTTLQNKSSFANQSND